MSCIYKSRKFKLHFQGFLLTCLEFFCWEHWNNWGTFSLHGTSTLISYNCVVRCAVWKLSKIHQGKKFVNDTFSCKVGVWKFLSRKIPIVVIVVILSRLFPTKGIKSMNYFFTCSKILPLWRSHHHLWSSRCPAFAVLWSAVPVFFVSPALSLVKKLQRELWKHLPLEIQAWSSQS